MRITNLASGFSQSITHELVGFNVGGGIEYAFTKNWIGRVEFIYDDYACQSYDFHSAGVFGSRALNFSEDTTWAVLEYKF